MYNFHKKAIFMEVEVCNMAIYAAIHKSIVSTCPARHKELDKNFADAASRDSRENLANRPSPHKH